MLFGYELCFMINAWMVKLALEDDPEQTEQRTLSYDIVA